MKNILLPILVGLLLVSCSGVASIPATASPVPTGTDVVLPTDTPAPTLTPTAIPSPTLMGLPTLQFYVVHPTLVATADSCSVLPDKMCISGMLIVLSGRKLNKYEVAVSWPGVSETSFECPQKALIVSFGANMAPVICDDKGLFFVSVGLTEVTIQITWVDGSFTQTLYPVYKAIMPQGPDCDPQCFTGQAEMIIP